ncbi:hypothetical protein [Nocardia sp. NPDC020380]|uniref:hypothetical protein n=1 Tax=Nocardia sp. NPDC020380 TaxID=3364309 RepID=UPI00379C5DCD
MVNALHAEVSEKVAVLRGLLDHGDEFEFIADFPVGVDLDRDSILEGYNETLGISVPEGLVDLYAITAGPQADSIELFSAFSKGELFDSNGEIYRADEHWLTVGLIGNDKFLVSLTTGEVLFADQYYWRYGESDSSRLVAPDMLTFFNECMIGPRYREFIDPEESDDPTGWYRFIQDNRLF